MLLFNRAFAQFNLDRRSPPLGTEWVGRPPRDSFLFGVESLQQHPQLLEAQFEFLGHLRPRGFRDVRKVECYVLVLEICECLLKGGSFTSPPLAKSFQPTLEVSPLV
jgi:hypothetical protein